MTDGERLVFDCNGDAVNAARAAARAAGQLRAVAQHLLKGPQALQIDGRDFLDEIVSVP